MLSKDLSDSVLSFEEGLSPENRAFYQHVFTKHHLAVHRFIRRMGLTEDSARDIVQDVYLRIVRQNEPTKLAQAPRAYLYRIAINLLRDGLRREQLQSRFLTDAKISEDPLTLTVTPERALQQKQNIEALKAAVRNLDPTERRILLLHRLNHMSCREIAKELSMPLRTVERRLSSAVASCGAFIRRVS